MNILITGGSSGLGKFILEHFAKDLANTIFFTYCNSKEAAEVIEKESSKSKKIHCDFNNQDSISSLCDFILNEHLDVVINNAYVGYQIKHFHKFKPAEYAESFMQNVSPTVQILQSAVSNFRKKKKGKILNILSSVTKDSAVMGYSVYSAEKKYLEAISNSIALENSKFNIQCNCLSPSFLETSFNSNIDDRVIEQMKLSAPQKKFLTNSEVAVTVLDIINNNSIYFNGQNIHLNAGR